MKKARETAAELGLAEKFAHEYIQSVADKFHLLQKSGPVTAATWDKEYGQTANLAISQILPKPPKVQPQVGPILAPVSDPFAPVKPLAAPVKPDLVVVHPPSGLPSSQVLVTPPQLGPIQ